MTVVASIADCRLCMDADKLYAKDIGIAFEAHRPGKGRAREQLVQLRRPTKGTPR